jgi:hypothetical protein
MLESVQNRFLKVIAYKTKTFIYDHEWLIIETEHNIMRLDSRRQIYDLVFLHKLLNNNIHSSDLINEINFKVPQR